MSNQEINKKTRFKKFLKWVLFRFPLFLVIIAVVMIGALKLVERYPVPLRQGFEEYLSKTTGTNATIGKLEKITFFPNFDIHIQNLTMHNYNNAAEIDLSAEQVEISAPFFSMLFSGRTLNKLHIENFDSKAGLITPLDVKLDIVNIVDRDGPDQYGSFVVMDGLYGNKKMILEAEIKNNNGAYEIPKQIPFSIKIGNSELNAVLNKGFTEVILENLVFSKQGKLSAAQDYPLVKSRDYNKDNPLMCMLQNGDAAVCDVYLKNKAEKEGEE